MLDEPSNLKKIVVNIVRLSINFLKVGRNIVCKIVQLYIFTSMSTHAVFVPN